jgi:hypothetical protein
LTDEDIERVVSVIRGLQKTNS